MKSLIASMALAAILIAAISISPVFSQSKSANNSNTIVIVHGSWSSAGDWDAVKGQLLKDGDEVMVINLPGHGTDNTPIAGISLQGYADVKKAIGTKTNIILVGHSFGGIVTSAVAEQIPTQIKKLVYVAAYVPKDGESLLAIANTDAQSQVPKYLQIDEKSGIAGIGNEGVADTFVRDAPKQVQDYVYTHFKAEPLVLAAIIINEAK